MYKIHWTVQLREQCKKSKQFLLCKYCVSNAEKRWDPVNSIPQFFVTKRLQLRFKKNTAAEPNGLLISLQNSCLLFIVVLDVKGLSNGNEC